MDISREKERGGVGWGGGGGGTDFPDDITN